ncbi:MAG: C39 family peptidase [Lentihominibacter sp.]|jgi:hypothetical protein
MKKKNILIAVLTIMMAMFSMAGCGGESEEVSAPEKNVIAVPENYETNQDDLGADSYDGWCDNPDTKYFVINDYYNMESGGTLHILSNFQTYQQTTEYSCGPASALMVLNWFGEDTQKYDEMTIAEMSGTSSETGVNPKGLNKFFTEIGWETEFNNSMEYPFEDLISFEEYVIEKIDAGIPVMVDWMDWAGHWQVIIGIDTMQEDNECDDVLILADPYDTSDHYQDGYYTFSAERFFYMWKEGFASDGPEPYNQPYLVAQPAK